MCEYCENKQYTIRISVDEWNEKEKKFKPNNNFEVDYCPMCGRKFEENKWVCVVKNVMK